MRIVLYIYKKFLRILYRLLNIILVILVIPFFILIIILKPLIHIRFGEIRNLAIGMNLFALAYILKKQQNQKRKSLNLFYYQNKKIVNSYLHKYSSKKLNINKIYEYFHLCNKKIFRLKSHIFEINHDDFEGILINDPYKFEYNDLENNLGLSFLKKIGFDKNKKIICLVVRDSTYKKKIKPEYDWSYHDYRDCDVDDFNESIQFLIDNGYQVIRIGKFVFKKSSFKNKNFFDYAVSELRTDFLDIWLMSNCSFCLSTGTGIDSVALISNIPIAYVNYLPLTNFPTFSNCIVAPKYLYWKNNNTKLTFEEYLDVNYKKTHEFDENGIVIKNLDSNMILNVTKEIYQKLNNISYNKTEKNDQYIEAEIKMKKYLTNKFNYKKIHKNSKISFNFFKDYFLS